MQQVAKGQQQSNSPDNEDVIRCIHVHDTLQKQVYEQAQIEYEKLLTKRALLKSQGKLRTEGETIYQVPYIVHIVHSGEPVGQGQNLSAAQVKAQIDVLNEDFRRLNADTSKTRSSFKPVAADIGIEFVPAILDKNGNIMDEPGINRINGGLSQWTLNELQSQLMLNNYWPPTEYFNIWVSTFTSNSGRTILGICPTFPYSITLPGLTENANTPHLEGVIINTRVFGSVAKFAGGNLRPLYNLGRTLTHETGHFFGLFHVWGDRSDCSGTDYCDDTPQSNTDYAVTTCPSASATSCGAVSMWENYMYYTPDACMNIFTNDQKFRIRTVLELSPRRSELLTSIVAFPGKLKANFSSHRNPCVGIPITFTDKTYTSQGEIVVERQWYFEGGNPSTSSEINPVVSYANEGTFTVKLIAIGNTTSDTVTKTGYITVQNTNSALTLKSNEGILLNENFDNDFPPSWSRTSTAWSVYTPTYYGGSAMIDNFANNYTTFFNYLESPLFDGRNASQLNIGFDVAYALASNNRIDSLVLYYKNVCSGDVQEIWRSGGSQMKSTEGNGFVPVAKKNWIRYEVDINPPFTFGKLSFLNIGGNGNRIYLDNINITAKADNADEIIIYPNPAKELLFVFSRNTVIKQITLASLDGKVWSDKATTTDFAQINLSDLAAGMYIIFLETDKGRVSKKVIVEK
jgi:PKD repeat protein